MRNIINKIKNAKLFLNEQEDKIFLRGEDLPKIQKFLQDIGLEVMPYDLNDPTNIAGNPLVRDGLNGIRASYNKRRNELKIWFTSLDGY